MVVALSDADEQAVQTTQYNYQYDQLNRIKGMQSGHLNYSGANSATFTPTGYTANYSYDANGNIEVLSRAKAADYQNQGYAPVEFDDFAYDYNTNSNQLNFVHDNVVNNAAAIDDLDQGQFPDNYEYDAIGQLISDTQEEIAQIDWKVNNKVKAITRTGSSNKSNLVFEYDGMGNRIAKKVIDGNVVSNITYYFRDAQGNPMAMYTHKNIENNGNTEQVLYLSEREIYGSSRVGQEQVNKVIASNNPTLVDIHNPLKNYTGDKRFELSNHLGNVLEVITDRALPNDIDNNNLVDNYTADVIQYSDYYPFGMQMEGRKGGNNDYRYGYQGSEKDDEFHNSEGTSYTTHFRQLDPRLGRWLSIDPKATAWESPYVSMGNNPIIYSDVLGDTIRYSNGTEALQVKMNEMRKKSDAFDVIVSYLESMESYIDIFVDDITLNDFGETVNGLAYNLPGDKGKCISSRVLIRSDLRSEIITEELFHAFQKDVYNSIVMSEKDLPENSFESKVAPLTRTFPEIESEANLMQVIVQAELGEKVTSGRANIYALTESPFFERLKENGFVVTPGTKIEGLYYEYQKGESILNEYSIYEGKLRNIIPYAVNRVISSTGLNSSSDISNPGNANETEVVAPKKTIK